MNKVTLLPLTATSVCEQLYDNIPSVPSVQLHAWLDKWESRIYAEPGCVEGARREFFHEEDTYEEDTYEEDDIARLEQRAYSKRDGGEGYEAWLDQQDGDDLPF